MMKVLLIQSPLGRQERPVYPLGLAYLAGVLSEKYQVQMADANLQTWSEICKTIDSFQPGLIGLGLKYIDTAQSYDKYSYFQHFPHFVTMVREAAPQTILVVGGTGFSLFPKEVMTACDEIDFGVELEGEETFCTLLENLNNPKSVAGIYYRDGKEFKYSSPSRFPDFVKLPFPRRLLDPKLYQQNIDQFGVLSKRGCIHRCLYCNYPYLNGRSLRIREPQSVLEELAQLKKDYGIRYFAFADAIFNEPREHAEAIMEEMIRRNLSLKWTAYFSIRNFDIRFFELATRASCELFQFSPDGLSQATMDSLQKGIIEEQVRSVMELFQGLDFPRFVLCLMFNVPSSSFRDFLLLCRAVFIWPRKYRALEDVTVTNMRIYPNTPLYKISVEKGIIDSEQDLINPTFYNPGPLKPFSKLINIKSFYRF